MNKEFIDFENAMGYADCFNPFMENVGNGIERLVVGNDPIVQKRGKQSNLNHLYKQTIMGN